MNAIRHAVRASFGRGRRLVSLAILITVAFGIGTATSVFSIVDALLIRPPDFPRGHELVYVGLVSPLERGRSGLGKAADLAQCNRWQRDCDGVIQLGGFQTSALAFIANGLSRNIPTVGVTSNLIDILGVPPLHGRTFGPTDDMRGSPRTALLSYGLWQQLFNGDTAAVGQRLTVGSREIQIIGIMPRGFHVPLSMTDDPQRFPEIWVPITVLQELLPGAPPLEQMPIEVIGRSGRPFPTVEQVLQRIPSKSAGGRGGSPELAQVTPLNDARVRFVRAPLILLSASVALLIFLMCFNVANLFFIRTLSRDREIAVKVALGISRERLVFQFVAEGLLIVLIGAALGCAVAFLAEPSILALTSSYLPDVESIRVNIRVLLFAALVAFGTGLFVSLWPACAATRRSHLEALAFRAAATSRRSARWMRATVLLEISLAVVVLVATSVLARSFFRFLLADRGYETENVAVGAFILPPDRYHDPAARRAFIAALLEGLRRSPALRSPAVSAGVPIIGGMAGSISSGTEPEARVVRARIWTYSGDYFASLGIHVLKGTVPDAGSGSVAVDMAAARSLFGSEDPVGRRVVWGNDRKQALVSAVVNDIPDFRTNLETNSVLRTVTPHLYVPDPASPPPVIRVSARFQGDSRSALESIHRAVAAVDKDLTLDLLDTIDGLIRTSLQSRKMILTVMVMFCGFAVLLASTGVFAVVAHSTAQRTHEMGVRIAVGARPGRIIKMILGEALRIAAIGSALGVLGAIWFVGLLRSLLFETSPLDMVSFVAVALTAGSIVVLSSLFPAWRVARTETAISLLARE